MWNMHTAQVRNLGLFFFFFFFFFFFSPFLLFFFLLLFVCECVECDEGFVHFLHIVAESPSVFPK